MIESPSEEQELFWRLCRDEAKPLPRLFAASLLAAPDPNALEPHSGMAGLHLAVGSQNLTYVTILLENRSIDPNRRTTKGHSALSLAVERINEYLVRMLLRDPRVEEIHDVAVYSAARNFRDDLMRLLIASGKTIQPFDWDKFPFKEQNASMIALLEEYFVNPQESVRKARLHPTVAPCWVLPVEDQDQKKKKGDQEQKNP